MLHLGGIHERLELIGPHGRREILGAEAVSLEFVDGIRGAVDHDGHGVRTERARIRHQVQSVIGLQP